MLLRRHRKQADKLKDVKKVDIKEDVKKKKGDK